MVDVRVEDHPDPLTELRRLAALAEAYARVDEAETLLAAGRPEDAVAIYDEVLAAHPDNQEFAFWAAVALAGAGRDDEARTVGRGVLASPEGDRWRELLERLPPAGLTEQRVVDALLR
ncbi:MAG TPA: tetratricopeptide repeat protein [Acidimicrobiales bacterium]|nr:tetratricopeptide repeat protein [Acidimicrobiales bacterium]